MNISLDCWTSCHFLKGGIACRYEIGGCIALDDVLILTFSYHNTPNGQKIGLNRLCDGDESTVTFPLQGESIVRDRFYPVSGSEMLVSN